MPKVNIGNQTSVYDANQADTTYVLKQYETVSTNSPNGINASAGVDGRVFEISGKVHNSSVGVWVGESGATASDSIIHIGKTGIIQTGHRGVVSYGNDVAIGNDGVITCYDGNGIGINAVGDHLRLTNTGYISAQTGATLNGIDIDFNNSGVLSGFTGVNLSSVAGDTSKLNNSGLLHASGGTAVSAGAERDSIVNSGTINGDIQLSGGDDTFRSKGGHINGVIVGGKGDDTYHIDDASIKIVEKSGDGFDFERGSVSFTLADFVEEGTLTGTKNTKLTGTANGDILYGNSGSNWLIGGLGSDYITGGRGNDRLFGGEKVASYGDLGDIFIFDNHSGKDVIVDFQDGLDRLDLKKYDGIDGFGDLKIHDTASGNVVIDLLSGDRITLVDVDKAHLSDLDFQF